MSDSVGKLVIRNHAISGEIGVSQNASEKSVIYYSLISWSGQSNKGMSPREQAAAAAVFCLILVCEMNIRSQVDDCNLSHSLINCGGQVNE